jgi:hypothetical protein
MKNKTQGMIMQLPAQIILVLTVIGAFYAKISGAYPMLWATPITILIIVALYFLGIYFEKKGDNLY